MMCFVEEWGWKKIYPCPCDYTKHHLLSHYLVKVTHSIPACIGEVTLNSKQLDKDSPVSVFAVRRCYVAAQEGTFFEGSGYAALGMYYQQFQKRALGFTSPLRR